jgi:peptidoglycan LD-endopeptidase CwlK
MASRSLADLDPTMQPLAEKFIRRCREAGLDVLIYCTLRPAYEQAQLYRQGRSMAQIRTTADRLRDEFGRPDLCDLLIDVGPQQGPKVTQACPGQSLHNYGLAFDAVPLRAGRPVWGRNRPEDKALWESFGACVRKAGLEWGGDWPRFRDFPHAQMPGADWRKLIGSWIVAKR